jgi:hypothetical protein
MFAAETRRPRFYRGVGKAALRAKGALRTHEML